MCLHGMVTEIKRDKEASVEYMKAYEREQMIREEGREEGREAGREEGISLGESKFVRLVEILLKNDRSDLIPLVTEDAILREEYYKQYGIS